MPALASSPAGHKTEVVLLGTKGGPTADAQRSEPATLLLVDGAPYLVDVGEGTARQLAAVGLAPPAIRTVFITHHHLDHTAGLEPLMALTWIGAGLRGPAAPPMKIYGPPATQELVEAALSYISVSERIFRAGIPSLPKAGSLFAAHELDGRGGIALDDGRVTVRSMENSHFGHASTGRTGARDLSLAYRFETAAGAIVITGDTGPSDALALFAKGADVLVSEVYVAPQARPGASPVAAGSVAAQLAEHMNQEHLTPENVARLALSAGVKKLVLTHLVVPDDPAIAAKLRRRIGRIYKGEIIVGRDLERIALQR